MRSTFKITFFVKKQTVYKDGKSPIMGRIRINTTPSDFSTKLTTDSRLWDETSGKVSGKNEEAQSINNALDVIKGTVTKLNQNLLTCEGYVTSARVRDAYLDLTKTDEERERNRIKREKEEQAKLEKEQAEKARKEEEERGAMLIDYFNLYIEARRDEVGAGILTQKTFSRYENVRDRLIAFMKEKYKVSDIPLKKLDLFFVNSFEMHLRVSSNKNTKEAIRNNTVMKLMQKLSTVITLAHNTGIIPLNPFCLYKFHFEETERDILTWEEIEKMYSYDFDNNKLDQVRDCYIFSCFTGLAYTDINHFTDENIKANFNQDWIIKRREKTNVESKVILMDIARDILKKYKGKLPDGQSLPVISNQNLNDYLKIIAAHLGIKKKLTFHLARHTFATTVCLSNGIPLETLQKMMGHKSIRTTQIYAKIVDLKLNQDMGALDKRLKKKNLRSLKDNQSQKEAV